MSARHAVLLVGSARPRGQSTSEALGRYLLARLEAVGWESEVLFVSHVRGAEGLGVVAAAIEDADLFVLAAPVYVDALPHLVTAALEHVAAERSAQAQPTPCRFLALLNCGLPEAKQTEVAQAICRSFARAARLDCAGTLGLGGGEAIHGRRLDRLGFLTRNVRRALDLTAEAVARGRKVPEKAGELMSRPMFPVQAYTLAANTLFWRRRAQRYGVVRLLDARPYANE